MVTSSPPPPRPAAKNAALSDLWRRYQQRKDAKARDQIINHYAYLVKITAGRIAPNLPANVERDDLVGVGVVGLINAVDQFDTGRQVKFETYAIALIRGAILEYLRQADWVPRSVRDKMKVLDQTYKQLEVRLGRPATEREAAEEMGLSEEEMQKLLVFGRQSTVGSLDDLLPGGGGGEGLHLGEVIEDGGASVVTLVETAAVRETLARGIDRLPERERLVTSLYYYEGLTFKEIGLVMEVSESRVYQLHGQATNRLRGYLQRDAPLFTDAPDESSVLTRA
jgi:RNA polymerase sigma factor for flagellar operon FliA